MDIHEDAVVVRERKRNLEGGNLWGWQGGKVPIDVAEAEHRRFIIDRCRVSVQVLPLPGAACHLDNFFADSSDMTSISDLISQFKNPMS